MTKVPKLFGPCHDINPLGALRNSSGNYLTNLANKGIFSDNINRSLKTAGNLYKDAFKQWQKLYEYLGHHIDDATKNSKEQRLKGANAVKQALKFEEDAIQELDSVRSML